jgi:hypothetical protein
MTTTKTLDAAQRGVLIASLKLRFEKHMPRHAGLDWAHILARLQASPEKLWSLHQMESTGGEPDVTGVEAGSGELVFTDCSPESPAGRRSICFDPQALADRKENKPKDSALGMASKMGIEILSEDEYRALQTLGEFDLKTSSWVATPPSIRKLGGALFCDRRYDHVFTYHNGADSYYAARGFRGRLRV